MLQHFGHLKNTCPSLKPNCCIISLVALPFGTAPYIIKTKIQLEYKVIFEAVILCVFLITYRIGKHGSNM